MLSSTTAAVIINEWAEGEWVHDGGGGGNIDYTEGGGGGEWCYYYIFLSFWKSEIFGRFAADLRILTPYRVDLINKKLIFGLDSTTNR